MDSEKYMELVVNHFKSLPNGIQRLIHVILAYHYDAILREIKVELDSTNFSDEYEFWVEFLESEFLTDFLNQIEES